MRRRARMAVMTESTQISLTVPSSVNMALLVGEADEIGSLVRVLL